ncbi:hypothetical protein B0H13DRAFT_1935489 [Mycena leptocephala]|nr:hypothetical protein B0H13DRAFT_1935489 [Mycena leptocephala]
MAQQPIVARLGHAVVPVSRTPRLLRFATVAHAAVFNVQAPTSAKSNGAITITWESDTSDECEHSTTRTYLPLLISYFRQLASDIALFSTDPSYATQNGPFAIANNVDPEANKATIVLPRVVPGYIH